MDEATNRAANVQLDCPWWDSTFFWTPACLEREVPGGRSSRHQQSEEVDFEGIREEQRQEEKLRCIRRVSFLRARSEETLAQGATGG